MPKMPRIRLKLLDPRASAFAIQARKSQAVGLAHRAVLAAMKLPSRLGGESKCWRLAQVRGRSFTLQVASARPAGDRRRTQIPRDHAAFAETRIAQACRDNTVRAVQLPEPCSRQLRLLIEIERTV
jgi:hypothetical protein